MITLCHAMHDAEVLYIRAALQNAGIPHFIIGEGFGSLYPGIQIASYNERRFLVPEAFYRESIDIVNRIRDIQIEVSREEFTLSSKLRIVVETLVFGWSSLGGKRKSKVDSDS